MNDMESDLPPRSRRVNLWMILSFWVSGYCYYMVKWFTNDDPIISWDCAFWTTMASSLGSLFGLFIGTRLDPARGHNRYHDRALLRLIPVFLLVWGVALAVVGYGVPALKKTFDEYGLSLSSPTKTLFRFQNDLFGICCPSAIFVSILMMTHTTERRRLYLIVPVVIVVVCVLVPVPMLLKLSEGLNK